MRIRESRLGLYVKVCLAVSAAMLTASAGSAQDSQSYHMSAIFCTNDGLTISNGSVLQNTSGVNQTSYCPLFTIGANVAHELESVQVIVTGGVTCQLRAESPTGQTTFTRNPSSIDTFNNYQIITFLPPPNLDAFPVQLHAGLGVSCTLPNGGRLVKYIETIGL